MAHGRVSVVLGVQAGLGAIIQFAENFKKGMIQHSGVGFQVRNRLTDAEILSVLNQVSQIDAMLRREGVTVSWTALGASPHLEIPLLAKVLGFTIEDKDLIAVEEIETFDNDALIYVPLDIQQPRQVEHLARLSMTVPRVRHVALAAAPKWNHSQLMALRETWEWVDPKQQNKTLSFAEEIVRSNGGITRKDLAKINLPEFRKEESMDPVIITRSPRMKDVLSLVDAVADTDSTILISGDSGTGKELIAQRIHARCHRAANPLVAVNCGAIPEELLESELFGHVKGAFTGAVSNREGRFQAAEGGTLFLDEIGEMGANLQVKLLRVLQTRKYEPVGSTKTKASDVRIIAATNRDLEHEVKENRFREDLFYRLNVIPIYIPGLKERKEDVQLLVDHFVRKFNSEKSRRVTGVTRASLRALVAYDWPGNVRELENLMERMVILKSSGMIDVLDFPEKYRRKTLSEIEYDDLMNASNKVGSGSSTQIGISHSAMQGFAAASAASPQSLTNQIGNQQTDDESGEEAIMKFTGQTVTKGQISQNAGQSQSASVGMSQQLDQAANAVEANHESAMNMQEIEGNMSIEQAIRLISDKVVFPVEGLDFNSVVDQFENILILQALERTGWNRNRAAQLLRLNRTTLVEKLKKKQLMPPLRYGDQILEGNA